MTENAAPAPAAAVQIVVTSMRAWPLDTSDEDDARAVVAALAREGWLHDPTELAAPMRRLRELLTLHSRDWALDRRDALLWALLVGWECEGPCTEGDDPEHTCDDALREVAQRHQWPPQFVAGVRAHRAALAALTPTAASGSAS